VKVLDRLEDAAAEVGWRFRGRNPATVAVGVVRRFVDVRIAGLAAEMTYYALLSVVPLIGAFGAGLGAVERLFGGERAEELQDGLVEGIEAVLSAEVADEVAVPLVEDLLTQQRTGLALGGLAVSLWLASRMFRAAIRALDDAYGVEERRTLLQQYVLSVGFVIGALVLAVVCLSMLVVGPLLGGGRRLAGWIGAESAFAYAWNWGRWPVVAVVAVTFLAWLYRAGPNVDNRWRDCLPGAAVAAVCLVAVTVGFQAYLRLAGPQEVEVGVADDAVRAAAQLLGVLLVSLLYAWMANICLLLGGVVNAEWSGAARAGAPAVNAS